MENLCCDTCLITDGRYHTDICDSSMRSSTTASSPTPSSGDNSDNDGSSGLPCTGCFRSSCPANVGSPAFHDLCRIHGCVRRATDTEHGNNDVCCDRCSLTSGQFHTALCDAADYDLNAPSSATVPAAVGTTDVNDFIPGKHNYNSAQTSPSQCQRRSGMMSEEANTVDEIAFAECQLTLQVAQIKAMERSAAAQEENARMLNKIAEQQSSAVAQLANKEATAEAIPDLTAAVISAAPAAVIPRRRGAGSERRRALNRAERRIEESFKFVNTDSDDADDELPVSVQIMGVAYEGFTKVSATPIPRTTRENVIEVLREKASTRGSGWSAPPTVYDVVRNGDHFNGSLLTASGRAAGISLPLLLVHPRRRAAAGPHVHLVEAFGSKFTCFDLGDSLVTADGVAHSSQCVLLTLSVLDLVHDGFAPLTGSGSTLTDDVVQSRGTALITAFLSQLSQAAAELGPPKPHISVFEAEFRENAKDVVNFNDHDARVALWCGRDLPDSLQFSTRSWSSLRIIVVVRRVPDSPVSVFVMEGPLFGVTNDSWTAWQLVTQNHSMPMRPADGSAFHGARGADAFLRALPSFGIVAVVEKMQHWRAFLNRGDRRKVPLVGSRFFGDGEGCIYVSRQFASSMRPGQVTGRSRA